MPTQLTVLAVLSFIVWTAESLFEYLYGVMWRNLAQSTQHSLRLEAYDHLQKLEMDFFDREGVIGDDATRLKTLVKVPVQAVILSLWKKGILKKAEERGRTLSC